MEDKDLDLLFNEEKWFKEEQERIKAKHDRALKELEKLSETSFEKRAMSILKAYSLDETWRFDEDYEFQLELGGDTIILGLLLWLEKEDYIKEGSITMLGEECCMRGFINEKAKEQLDLRELETLRKKSIREKESWQTSIMDEILSVLRDGNLTKVQITNKLGLIAQNTSQINSTLKSFWENATPVVVELKEKSGLKRILSFIPAIINLASALIKAIWV